MPRYEVIPGLSTIARTWKSTGEIQVSPEFEKLSELEQKYIVANLQIMAQTDMTDYDYREKFILADKKTFEKLLIEDPKIKRADLYKMFVGLLHKVANNDFSLERIKAIKNAQKLHHRTFKSLQRNIGGCGF